MAAGNDERMYRGLTAATLSVRIRSSWAQAFVSCASVRRFGAGIDERMYRGLTAAAYEHPFQLRGPYSVERLCSADCSSRRCESSDALAFEVRVSSPAAWAAANSFSSLATDTR